MLLQHGAGESKTPNYFIFFDTETDCNAPFVNGFQKQKLLLGWLCFYDRRKKKKKWFYFETNKQFYSTLNSIISKIPKKEPVWIYAHNIEYDLNALNAFVVLFSKENNYRLKSLYQKGLVTVIRTIKNRRQITFLSTTNYIQRSLKDMGYYLGLEKIELDLTQASHQAIKDYCRRDVEIIVAFIETLLTFLHENNLGALRATIGSLAFNGFRHNPSFYSWRKEPIMLNKEKRSVALELKSYRGGFTQMLRTGKHKNTHYIDVNGLYAFIMATKQIPVTHDKHDYFESKDKERLLSFLLKELSKENVGVIADVEICLDKEHAFIPDYQTINGNKLLVRWWGKHRMVLCSPELKWVIKEKQKITGVYALSLYKTTPALKKYSNYFQKIKESADKENNLLKRQLAKSYNNNLYGKFAEKKIEFKLFLLSKDITPFKNKIKISSDGLDKTIHRFGNDYYASWSTNQLAKNTFPAISAFITSEARVFLIEKIMVAEAKNVYNCDTDSIFLNTSGFTKLKPFIDKTKTGCFKDESSKDKLYVGYQEKNYEYGNKHVHKGIPKRAKLIIEEKTSFKYEYESPLHLQTLRNKGLQSKHALWTRQQKEISKKYNKGKVDAHGYTQPLRLNR